MKPGWAEFFKQGRSTVHVVTVFDATTFLKPMVKAKTSSSRELQAQALTIV